MFVGCDLPAPLIEKSCLANPSDHQIAGLTVLCRLHREWVDTLTNRDGGSYPVPHWQNGIQLHASDTSTKTTMTLII